MNAVAVRLRACAKINWSLEVLGRRADGYHEVCTVLQTVALRDDIELRRGSEGFLVETPLNLALPTDEHNLAERARYLYTEVVQAPSVALRLVKRIPAAAGLGGGSSDGAAVLRAMNLLSGQALSEQRLEELAAQLGSDVPFFLRGGTQLAGGRGELLTALPDAPPVWLVLVTPPIATERKTARLYGLLRQGDFSDGSRVAALVERLRNGSAPAPEQLVNSFDRVAAEAFPVLNRYREALAERCGHAVLCGAGPSLFALAASEQQAVAAVASLEREAIPACAVRTLGAAESTAVNSMNQTGVTDIIKQRTHDSSVTRPRRG